MLVLPPAFSKPQFSLVADTHSRKYASVSNTLYVLQGERETEKLVAVNTGLFPILKFFKVPPETDVCLYLYQRRGLMIFGVEIEGGDLIDLWSYARSAVPKYFLT